MNPIVNFIFHNPDLAERAAKEGPEVLRGFLALAPVAAYVEYLNAKKNLPTVAAFAKAAPKATEILKGYLGLPTVAPGPTPAPGPAPSPSSILPFATDFLRGWPGGDCSLFFNSHVTTDSQRAGLIAYMRANSYTCVCSYAKNVGDGDGKHPVDVVADLTTARRNLQAVRDAGLRNVVLIFSDSCGVKGSALTTYAQAAVRGLDDMVDLWITFLEPGDTASDAEVNAVGKAVRALTLKPVLIHTHPVVSGNSIKTENLRFAKQSWCDGVAVQVTHPGSPVATSKAAGIVNSCANAIPSGKWLLMFEYSWTSSEKSLGDAFASTGKVHGLGDGCSAATVARLPRILGLTSGNMSKADLDPEAIGPAPEATGVSVKWDKYPGLSWTGINRTDWPSKTVDDANCNALVYLDGRKVEWVRKGANKSSIWNAVNPKDAKYYRPELRSGVVVQVSLYDTNGKHRVTLGELTIP